MCFLSPTSDPTQTMTSTIYAPPKQVTPVTPVTPGIPVTPGTPVIQPVVDPKPIDPPGHPTNPVVVDPGNDIKKPSPEDNARKGLAMKKGDKNKRGDTGLNIKKG